MRRRFSLRLLLFLCFTVLSAGPVVLLGLWVQDSALKNEVAAVHEKHLLLARNLGGALDRYATDAKAVFRLVTASIRDGQPVPDLDRLLKSLHFRHVCVSDGQGQRDMSVSPVMSEGQSEPSAQSFPAALAPVYKEAAKNPGEVIISGVTKDAKDRPTLFVVSALDDNRFVVGALATDYLVKVQQEISFGERGHAAIVDQYGRAMAHPVPSWRATMKDMTFLPPVQKMLEGKTGVITFYTPAMQADVVAGYTSVPSTGWGAMIPQPFPELVKKANEVRLQVAIIAGLALLVTAIISWWAARALATPLHAMASAAVEMSKETVDPHPIPTPPPFAPHELQELVSAFNVMAGEVNSKSEELRLEATRADVASRSKSDFLAHMSHELRTPLNAIIGFSEVIQSATFGPIENDRYARYIDDILLSARHLRELIESILDLSKVDAGALDLEESNVDVPELIRNSLVFLRDMAETNAVTLDIDAPDSLPRVRGDERILRQVLLNLLSNAVKFTPNGGTVTVRATPLGTGALQIQVVDNGIGIDETDLNKVTEPFAQLNNPLHTRHAGTGLGLYLAKTFMELHDGALTIASTPGEGTTVTLWLPPERRVG